MEPLFPSANERLEALAIEVLKEASALGAIPPAGTRRGLVELLRTVNCYYSNRIEGHDTRPADIERAMHDLLSQKPELRALQREARAHIQVQVLVEDRMASEPGLDVCAPDFLMWIHRAFYERVPEEFRTVAARSGDTAEVVPGALRSLPVVVGRHHPPDPASVPGFLTRFDAAYGPTHVSALKRVYAMAASHHRLMWIHPFLDGNGRVTRLHSFAYAVMAGVGGEGLWSVSRGLARRRDAYMEALAAADEPRRSDYDGRGSLSQSALDDFVAFFLETCLDQIRYMRGILQLDSLGDRLIGYAALRVTGNAVAPERTPDAVDGAPFRSEAGLLLREVMLRGEVARGEAERITGLGERSARTVLSGLVKERLLISDGPKLPVRLGFPSHAMAYWFPMLYPEGVAWEQGS